VSSLSLASLPALADRWTFTIKTQKKNHEVVVIHAATRLEAEKKLRDNHPNCVIKSVEHKK
jgi:hypothetical protein